MLIIALVAWLQVSASDVVAQYHSVAVGQEWEFTVRRGELERTPLWPETDEHAPLSPRRAVAAARAELARHVAGTASWSLSSVTMKPLVGPGRWVYLIGFAEPARTPDGFASTLEMVVLMDGTAVRPRRTSASARPQ